MEKKKLLLVAISVGVFLVISIGAALFVFAPQKTETPSIAGSGSIIPGPDSGVAAILAVSSSEQALSGPDQPASIDVVDLVRNPVDTLGIATPNEGTERPGPVDGAGTSGQDPAGGTVISVPRPTSAAVPDTPPAPRRTTTPAPSTQAPAPSTPAATTPKPAAPVESPAPSRSTAPTNPPSTPAPAPASAPVQTENRAPVQVESRPAVQTRVYDDYWVQTGAFSSVSKAEGVKEALASKGITSIIENGDVNGTTLFRVRVGPYTSRNEADYWLSLIKSINGFEDSQVRLTQTRR